MPEEICNSCYGWAYWWATDSYYCLNCKKLVETLPAAEGPELTTNKLLGTEIE